MEVFFIFALVIVGVVFFSFRHSKNVNEAWSSAASKLRLKFDSGFGRRRIHGDRVDLSLDIKTENQGKVIWTKYVAEFKESLPLSVSLHRQGYFSDVKNAFLNRIDIETGDPAFDQKVIVDSKDAEKVRKFLDEPVRRAVMNLLNQFDQFEMNRHRVVVKQKRAVTNRTKLVDDIRLLESSTRKFREAAVPARSPAKVPPPLPSKTKKRDEDEPVAAVPETEEKPRIEEEVSVVPIPEIEIESTKEPGPRKEREAVPVDEVSEPGPEGDSIFASHCRELFSECKGRYEMTRVFDSEFKGNEVEESDLLIRAEPFSIDRIFGRGPGVRRTFSMGHLENGEELLLVADTTGERSLSEVKQAEGTLDSFSGTLISFDPFSRTLFLKEHLHESPAEPGGTSP